MRSDTSQVYPMCGEVAGIKAQATGVDDARERTILEVASEGAYITVPRCSISG